MQPAPLSALLLVLVAASGCAISVGSRTPERAVPACSHARIAPLDEAWLVQPYRDHDMTAYDRIVAEGFTITHSNGGVLTRAEKRADILAAEPLAPGAPFRLGMVDVRCYGATAVSVGVIHEANRDVRFTNTYAWLEGRWRAVAAQLTAVRR